MITTTLDDIKEEFYQRCLENLKNLNIEISELEKNFMRIMLKKSKSQQEAEEVFSTFIECHQLSKELDEDNES